MQNNFAAEKAGSRARKQANVYVNTYKGISYGHHNSIAHKKRRSFAPGPQWKFSRSFRSRPAVELDSLGGEWIWRFEGSDLNRSAVQKRSCFGEPIQNSH